jgi:hypothetical protein
MALALIGSFAAVSFWEDESGLLGAVALVALLLPLGKLLAALYQTKTVTFDQTAAIVSWWQGLKKTSIRIPLTDFAGVARWSGNRMQTVPLFTWNRRWWVVALVHRSAPQCSLPILLSEDFAPVIATQKTAAKALGLPLLLEAPHGAAWRPRPAEDLDTPLGPRLNEIWANEIAPIPLPQQVYYAPGGPAAWGREVTDRWLWLLFLAPIGGFFGGIPGLIGALLPAVLVYASLWNYWRSGDSWACNGQALDLTVSQRWRGIKTERIPCSAILAARVVMAHGDSCLEVETQNRTDRIRLGQTPPRQARDSLETLFACLRQG